MYLLIRFPGHILSAILEETGHDGSSHDLSSFNLNLGDFGQCRLVASLHLGNSKEECCIKVKLSVTSQDEESDDKFSITSSMLVVNEEGCLLHQV